MIAHWPSLPAKLSGKVIGIEHGKYYVEYDDGDKHHNTIEQLRILKPPLYFGKRVCSVYTYSHDCCRDDGMWIVIVTIGLLGAFVNGAAANFGVID